jgi:putative PIN family toxin of toxin-antitoxin system
MISRKRRTPVVLDTNVFVRALKSRSVTSSNQRVLRLWLLRKVVQLIASQELVDEYIGVFRDVLGLDEELIEQWRKRWFEDTRTTIVNLGRRFYESRDPDDNLLLATAAAGRAKYLITNDRDLLDLSPSFLRSLPFRVMTPSTFLKTWMRETQS